MFIDVYMMYVFTIEFILFYCKFVLLIFFLLKNQSNH
ncbi:hypothetical protein JOE44_002568 [Chryseobacterium sp. PvR013]|nr:hypothetical protein [Chryseobacterium sp. PvR013]